MAIRTDSPQVKALILEAEKKFGRPVRTPSDFVLIADKIESKTGEHISDSTIKRLCKPNLAYKTVSERSLNVIAQYVGYPHFDAFCQTLEDRGILEESEIAQLPGGIFSDRLSPGDKIRIAWQPNRMCLLRYEGQHRYTVLETANAKIHAGDSFTCASFVKGRPLYVDNLMQGTTLIASYGMGTSHGLTLVERESEA